MKKTPTQRLAGSISALPLSLANPNHTFVTTAFPVGFRRHQHPSPRNQLSGAILDSVIKTIYQIIGFPVEYQRSPYYSDSSTMMPFNHGDYVDRLCD
jgi:hypothetical protein